MRLPRIAALIALACLFAAAPALAADRYQVVQIGKASRPTYLATPPGPRLNDIVGICLKRCSHIVRITAASALWMYSAVGGSLTSEKRFEIAQPLGEEGSRARVKRNE